MIRFLLLVASLCTALPAAARTQSARCAVNFAGGVPPAVDAKHSVQTRLLCFRGFAVQYSGLTKTPLWSAEHLTPRRMRAADAQPREGAFHPEPRLPATMQSTLADYRGSGYDRGHMAPSGDMPDPRSQRDSFSLANIVPQAPCNNQVIWEQIESGVRAYVAQGNDGQIKLTRDKSGLKRARWLRDLAASVVQALEAQGDLPESVPPPKPTGRKRNPFA